MKKIYSVDEYIEEHPKFSEALALLRKIINSTEAEETIKWNAPVYCVNGKNVFSFGAFKNHFCVWFFNGVFLEDKHQILTSNEKTKSMRQMRFESIDDIDENLVLSYVKEAIENQKLGKEIKPDKSKSKQTIIPKALDDFLTSNDGLKTAFELLTPFKQREYGEFIDGAKREATKQSRLEKIKPMILKNIGLNDKYRS